MISSWARGTSSFEAADARIAPTAVVPMIFLRTVSYGAMTMSSWSCPIVDPPLDSRTPTTLNGMFLMRIVLPIGSSSPKRFVFTVCPSTHTLLADRLSWSVKNWPCARFQERMSGQSTSPPWIDVDQFWLP